MTRYGNTDYNSSGSSSDGGDYKDRQSVKLSRYATLEFDLAGVGTYAGQYGQQLIVSMDDVLVRDGVVMERHDGKLKVFGLDAWFERDPETMELIDPNGGTVTIDMVPDRHTESFGGTTYRYEKVGGAIETNGDEPVEIGDCEIWLSNSTKARTLAKVLSARGDDIIFDRDDDNGWLAIDSRNEQFPFRDDLDGRRVMLWFEKDSFTPDGEDEPVEFTDAVLLDAATEAGITKINDAAAGGDGDDSDDGAGGAGGAAGTIDGGFPDEVDDLIDVFARTGQTDRERIRHMIEGEVDDPDTIDMDAVMEEVRERAAAPA